MGEATYYFRAVFRSVAAAKCALPKLKAHLREHDQAYHEWQEIRDQPCPRNLYRRLRRKYPSVFKYVDMQISSSIPESEDRGMNNIAPFLICACESDGAYRIGTELRFSATVWHLDNWEPLMSFTKKALGCHMVGYLSDEGEGFISARRFYERGPEMG